jgi:hypothetical protein
MALRRRRRTSEGKTTSWEVFGAILNDPQFRPTGFELSDPNNGVIGLPLGAVPEPTWAMMLLGFAGIGFMSYRRSRKDQGLALAHSTRRAAFTGGFSLLQTSD